MASTRSGPVRAWSPDVAGVAEVLHATFTDHAYPPHTHATWTVLVVDRGAVRYELDRHAHATRADRVTLLPPDVPHDGRAATADGFRKRVVYLTADRLGLDRTGAAVDTPDHRDPDLRGAVDRLHRALAHPGDELAAETHLASVVERLRSHLSAEGAVTDPLPDAGVARRLRELLDARVVDGVRLAEAAGLLGVSETHLVRSFRRAYGIPPHRYLTGLRLDRARRLLLAGTAPAEVAQAVGFVDQSHLTRHFRGLLGTTPAAYAGRRRSA